MLAETRKVEPGRTFGRALMLKLLYRYPYLYKENTCLIFEFKTTLYAIALFKAKIPIQKANYELLKHFFYV